jgi:DNA-binding MarR family transcriptional regulator/N-acetylglutamate synthase-like GNAT family acetyltransferase
MHVTEMRRFNRFYTRLIGVLDEGHLASPYSLAQVRVLYELMHGASTAAALCERLALDPGYSSRLLQELERRGLISRERATGDRRQVQLALTAKGTRAANELDRKASDSLDALLAPLAPVRRSELTRAMQQIRRAFEPAPAEPYVLRDPQPGDLGWIVHRHGVLYSEEYGWDQRFEALVATIVAGYVENHDTARERCWIAERDGAVVGSVFLVAKSRTVAQLRLLYVEPSARGLGIGARLVQECTRFARRVGYRKIVLWTNSVLGSARKIYEAEGYRLVAEEPHSQFGTPLVSQTWELTLTGTGSTAG